MKLENTKSREDKRIGGVIYNWWVDDIMFGKDNPVVRGWVSGDWVWQNAPIRTSVIVNINEDETELETLNTIYQLRDKREQENN